MVSNGYNVYKNNSINYASNEQLLLMLVDGAVKFAKKAEIALEEKKIKDAHDSIMRTEDIFLELMSSLDRSAGEWAVQIYKVYQFIHDKLIEANLKKDIKILQEIMPLIEDIRDTWHQAYKVSKGVK